MKTPKAESRQTCISVLVQNLGLAIAEGTLAPHSILRLDELEAQHSVSRSVVREATRVLVLQGHAGITAPAGHRGAAGGLLERSTTRR